MNVIFLVVLGAVVIAGAVTVWVIRRPSAPPPVPVEPETDEQRWSRWRRFIGGEHVCQICGLVVGDPDIHRNWHEEMPR